VKEAQQIVGREPNQRACYRQLASNVVACGRVNSTVRWLLKMFKLTLIAIAFCLIASISFAQSKPPAQGWPIIYIGFEKFGKAIDPMNERMAEGGDSARSKEKGKDVWLRFHNNSKFAISFRTDSMYLGKRASMYQFPDGSKVLSLVDGAEVSIQYQIAEKDRRSVPYGSDNAFISWLAPGRSVLFSVRREHLLNDRMIYIDFNYDWEKADRYSYNLAPVHRSEYYAYRLEQEAK
jgi:hypothetical protein